MFLIVGGILLLVVAVIGIIYFVSLNKTVAVLIANPSNRSTNLHIQEIEVYSGNVNVARKAKASHYPAHEGDTTFPAKYINDGNKTNFNHTAESNKAYIRLDLDAGYKVNKIVIYNRTDCCQSRLAGAEVFLINGRGVKTKVYTCNANNIQTINLK